jgi:hypothetical protein
MGFPGEWSKSVGWWYPRLPVAFKTAEGGTARHDYDI